MTVPGTAIRRRRGLGGRVGLGVALATLLLAASPEALAAPGRSLFADDFEAGLGRWSSSDARAASVTAQTSASPSHALALRSTSVTATSAAIDARVPALRVRVWIRRGSNKFSSKPGAGDDLALEYRDKTGSWVPLASWRGTGTQGEIFALDSALDGDTLGADFRLRFRASEGRDRDDDKDRDKDKDKDLGKHDAGEKDKQGTWHIDDVNVTEASASGGLRLGSCEEFDGGLARWSVSARKGSARTTGQAVHTPSQSLAISGGQVSVMSPVVDLSSARDVELRLWLRRGDDAFSEDPDEGDDLSVEFMNQKGRWKRLAAYPGDGKPGEIQEPAFRLPRGALHAGFRMRLSVAGRDGPEVDYWHVDSICLASSAEVADWRFEERAWSGRSAEVLDSSGNGHHATAFGNATTAFPDAALPGNPGTCGYAKLDGKADGIRVPASSGLEPTTSVSYALWIRPQSASGTAHLMGSDTLSGKKKGAHVALYASGKFLYGRAITAAGTFDVRSPLPALDQWTHVALTFDGRSLVLYTNAREAVRSEFAETTLAAGGEGLSLGDLPDGKESAFRGSLDEVRIYASALAPKRIVALMQEVHDCATTPLRFVIEHDGHGTHCQPESVVVRVFDLAGNRVERYAGTLTLDTQTGTGRFSLVEGEGAFEDSTPGDGRARYQFEADDGGEAVFALDYQSGPSTVDVDAYDAISRDDDAEGLLEFAASQLSMTAHAVPSPVPNPIEDPLGARAAGSAIELHLTAVGASAAGAACDAVKSYDGKLKLLFWAEHLDPARGPLVPTIDGQAIATNAAAAKAQAVSFAKGRAVVSVRYKDTGRVAIHASEVGAKMPLAGSTGGFVLLPANLRIRSVTNAEGDANPGAADPTGPLFARAGEAFRVEVDVEDAEGSLTPSYGRESVPEGIHLRSAALVAPADGRNGSSDEGAIENATRFTPDRVAGRFVGEAFAFDEVGAIRLQASVADGDYLGAGAIVGRESDIVGRFAPSHFEAVANAPKFATACPVGAFTWLGQPFHYAAGAETEIVVTAVSRAGETTTNYAGEWFRLTNATLAGRSYRAGSAAVDASGLPETTTDPNIESNGDGSATLRFSTGSGLVLARTAPRATFDAELELSIDIVDADGTAHPTNPFRVGGTTAGVGIAFDTTKRFQFGRLRVDNAYGSELVSLPMRLRAQRFDGTAFADDDSDSCSKLPASALILSPSPTKLATLPKIAHLPLFSGDAGLVMSAPRAPGDVGVRINLGATGANLPWLRSDWPEDGNLDGMLDDDPQARATFGIWEGRDAMIFLRELY